MHAPEIGFPWNLLGYVAAGNLALVQLTAVTGIFGLSFLVAVYNGLAAWARMQISRRKKTGMKLGRDIGTDPMGLLGAPVCPQAPADHVAHLVQTNFPVSMSYPANWMQAHASEMDQLERMSIGSGAKDIRDQWCGRRSRLRFHCRTVNSRRAPFASRAEQVADFFVGVVDWKPLGDGQRAGSDGGAGRPDGAARIYLRQNSPGAVQRIRSVEALAAFCQGSYRHDR